MKNSLQEINRISNINLVIFYLKNLQKIPSIGNQPFFQSTEILLYGLLEKRSFLSWYGPKIAPFMKSLTRLPLNQVSKKWNKENHLSQKYCSSCQHLPCKAIRTFHRNGISSTVFEEIALNLKVFRAIKNIYAYQIQPHHISIQILLALYFMKSACISPSRKTEAENRA